MSTVGIDRSKLKQSGWKAHVLRFGFGGVVTVVAGLIGARFGPAVGGLFLAFPAILPASLALVKKHDGQDAAGHEVRGACAGGIGLAAFGLVVWKVALAPWASLLLATAAWLAVSVTVWALFRFGAGRKQR